MQLIHNNINYKFAFPITYTNLSFPMHPNVKIFSGTASQYLAKQIALRFGEQLGKINIKKFSDGEIGVEYQESIRGQFVFLVQSTFSPTDNLMELLLMIDAAKRASAYKVIAVIPYYGYARQDRKDRPRVAIGSKLVANMLTAAGADRAFQSHLGHALWPRSHHRRVD